MMHTLDSITLICSLLVFFSTQALGAVVPLLLDGALESATVSSTDFNTGGSLTVNGVTVTVPKNLQVQFPAAWVPWKDVAAGNFLGNEVSITGNYVDDVPIAGQVSIAQFGLEANTGIIQSLAFDGTITMRSGQQVRIVDPNAVYSAGTGSTNAFWTADDVNPTVTSFSGFPMCVPRSADDLKCPTSNRPAGQNNFIVPNHTVAVPFQPGDYINYSGIKIGSTLFVNEIVCESVQVLTSGVPPYIRVEDAIIGVVDDQSPANVEFADTRFIGVTSDASTLVTISRILVDPCTGKSKEETIGTAQPVGVRNKWVYRANANVKTPYTREYRVTAGATTLQTNTGAILAGQYITPISEWIFPENTVPGTVPGKIDFSGFTYLRDGPGPDANGNIWGQLSPWPDTTAPAPQFTCNGPSLPPTTSATPAGPSLDPATDTVAIESYTFNNRQSGTVSVTARTSRLTGVSLSLVLNNPGPSAPIPMQDAGNGRWSVVVPRTKQPSNGITVRSTGGGSASRTTPTA